MEWRRTIASLALAVAALSCPAATAQQAPGPAAVAPNAPLFPTDSNSQPLTIFQGKSGIGASDKKIQWPDQSNSIDEEQLFEAVKKSLQGNPQPDDDYVTKMAQSRQKLLSSLPELALPPYDPNDKDKDEVPRVVAGKGILDMPPGKPRRSMRPVDAAFLNAASRCDATITAVHSFKDEKGEFPQCVNGQGYCRQAAADYDAKCQLRPQQTSLGDAVADRIERLTVSIYYHSGVVANGKADTRAQGPFCSGVLIAPDELMTARHCVVDYRGQTPALRDSFHFSARTSMKPMEDIPFAGYLNLPGSPDAEAADTDVEDDWVIVKLSKSVGDVEQVALEKPLSDEDLVVSGFSLMAMYGMAGGAADANAFAPNQDWTGFLRMDDTATCRTVEVPDGDGCFTHSCQTEHGGSGSPLFAVSPSGDIRLAGLQSRYDNGSSHNGGRCSENGSLDRAPNIATGVSDRMMEKVKLARGG